MAFLIEIGGLKIGQKILWPIFSFTNSVGKFSNRMSLGCKLWSQINFDQRFSDQSFSITRRNFSRNLDKFQSELRLKNITFVAVSIFQFSINVFLISAIFEWINWVFRNHLVSIFQFNINVQCISDTPIFSIMRGFACFERFLQISTLQVPSMILEDVFEA